MAAITCICVLAWNIFLFSSSVTCCWCQRRAHLRWRGSGWRARGDEGGLYHQLDLHGAQLTIGVRSHVTVRHQLVAVPEVPQVVDWGGSAQVAAGVVQPHLEEDVLTAEEDILGLVDGRLLGDGDDKRDLIW